MENNICQFCGGQYVFKDGQYVCPYCGYIKPEELTNEENLLLSSAAQKLRLANFDDAEEAYRDIIQKYPTHPDGYWGLVLSKYGVKYEQDYDGKMLPSCYATSMNSFVQDNAFIKALEFASNDQKEYYNAQAQKIETIRKTWVDKAQKEEPYDIFISYKDSDATKGIDRTEDSIKAYELYNQLSKEGYRVFYSRESLAQNTGEKYEPYIFNALNTAKVMVLYSSSVEYVESTWIKNEWLRYYKRIRNGEKQSNSLLVCYKGFDPGQLPKPLNQIQALNVDSLTFLQDLKTVVKNIISAANKVVPKIDRMELKSFETAATQKLEQVETRKLGNYEVGKITADEENNLKIAQSFIQKSLFKEAESIISGILDKNPRSERGLYLSFLLSTKSPTIEDFAKNIEKFDEYNDLATFFEVAKAQNAEKLLQIFSTAAKDCFNSGNFSVFDRIYSNISQYANQVVTNLHKDIYNMSLKLIAKDIENAKKFVLVSAQYYSSGKQDAYVTLLFNFAEECLKNSKFVEATEFYKEAAKYDSKRPEIYWGLLYSEIGSKDKNLSTYANKFTNYEIIENLIAAYDTIEKKIESIQKLLVACVKYAKNINEIDENNQVFASFEKLLSYIPKKYDQVFLLVTRNMAQVTKEREIYNLSEKYYAMILDIDSDDYQSHWGLLQSKLKCKTDDEIVAQDSRIDELVEYQNTITSAAKRNQPLDYYMDIKIKQDKAIKERAENALKLKKKKKKNRIIALVACIVCMCIAGGLGGFFAYRAETKLKYSGSSVYAGKYFEEENVVIPVSKDGVTITEIVAGAFEGDTTIKTLTLPTSLEVIGANAFKGCTSLTTIKFEDVDSSNIAYAAEGSSGKTSSLKKICQSAFEGCSSLVKFDMPDSVEEIDSCAFKNAGLKEVTLSTSLKKIGESAFEATQILEIDIPESLEKIGANVFNECNSLKSVNLNGRTTYPSEWGNNWISSSSENAIEVVCKIPVTIIENINESSDKVAYIPFGKDYVLEVPKKAGYLFLGYFDSLEESGNKLVDENGNSLSQWLFDSNTKLFAKWLANVNILILNGNGNTNGLMENQLVATDSTIKLPTNIFVKNGYEFIGWSISANGKVVYKDCDEYIMGTSPINNIYAVWKIVNYTITYDLNGGSANNEATYTFETESFALNNPTKTGYYFTGWSGTGIDNSSTNVTITKGSSGDRTYTANWTPIDYTIEYDLNGGVVSTNNPATYNIETETFVLNNPTKEGYTFVGWTGANGLTAQTSVSITKGNIENRTYKANWTPINYEITYNLNGGTNSPSNPNTYTIEDETILLYPTKNGYDFTGWSGTGLDNSSTNVTITEGSTGDRSYTANWTPTKYTVTYNLEGGIVESVNPAIYNVETETFTLNNPTKEYYDFIGWSGTGITGNSTSVSITKGSTGNRTYTANWAPTNYSITYNLNGGSANNEATYTIETENFTLNNPTKNGYDFTGWIGTGLDNSSTSVSITKGSYGDRTYTANWTPTNYIITYILNAGSANNESSYTIETETFTLNNPTKDYYNFLGWSGTELSNNTTSVSITKGSYGDRTYTANWTPINYTITYNLNGGRNNASNPIAYTVEDEINLIYPTKSTKETILSTTTLSNGNLSVDKEVTKYTFDGWYTESTFENKVSQISGHQDVSLYAKWNENVSITTTIIEQTYSRNGNSIEFGLYPQTQVIDTSLTSTLDEIAGILPTSSNSYSWTSYGYYSLGNISNYMWYIDIEEGGEKYRGVYFTQYRPYWTTNSTSTNNSYQDDNGYNINTVYWFKYELIKWTIVEESNGYATLVCDIAIDSQEYYSNDTSKSHSHNGGEGYSNNYALSNIRKWLNETFYNTAFNELQKSIILTTEVDNSVSSTGFDTNSYVCVNTNDKIYLLSYQEAITYYSTYASRQKTSTDYAKSQGCYSSTDGSYLGNCNWWLRSAGKNSSTSVFGIESDGEISNRKSNENAHFGVIPTIKIKLNYSITYDLDGGIVGSDNPTTYNVETETFTLNNPTKEHYNFAGWSGTGLSSSTTNVSITKGSYGNRTYTANWTPINYTISYNLNGGSVSSNKTTYTIETETFTLNNPTRLGYNFVGWSGTGLSSNTTNVSITKGSYGNRTYTANWTPINYTISYNLNGGTVSSNKTTYTIETETFTLNNPTKDYYNFLGWSGTGLSSKTINVSITKGSYGNRTYTANWTPIIYTISYDMQGGTNNGNNPSSITVESGEVILANPSRVGYTFVGWTGSNGSTPQTSVMIPANSHQTYSFTANWNVIEYSITCLDQGSSSSENYSISGSTITLNPSSINRTFTLDELFNSSSSPSDHWDQSVASSTNGSWTEVSNANGFGLNYVTSNNKNELDYSQAYALEKVTINVPDYIMMTSITVTARLYSYANSSSGSILKYEYTRTELQLVDFNESLILGSYCLEQKTKGKTSSAESSKTVTISSGTVALSNSSVKLRLVSFCKRDETSISHSTTHYSQVKDIQISISGNIKYSVESNDITLDNPTKVGYTFDGWTGSNGSIPQKNVTIPKGSIGNKVYTANWTPINYAITYNLNGGTNSSSNPSTYTVEDSSVVLANPTGDSLFCGWYINNQDGKYITTIDTSLCQDITVYALFDGTKGLVISGSEVNGYSGNETAVVVPKKYLGNTISSIAKNAFKNNTTISSVDIPDSITSIGTCAFYNCSGLTRIEIPASVTDIGAQAFSRCSGLTSIVVDGENSKYHSNGNCMITTATKLLILGCKTSVIPTDGSVTSIGNYAFEGCTGLTSIVITNTVTSIGAFAFSGCTGLTSIEIPNSVKKLLSWAFYECVGLKNIEIPNSVTSIGNYAFEGCTGLTSLIIGNSVTDIGALAFAGCSGLTSIEIPASVTDIGNQAFAGCSGLTSIEIPASVTDIGNQAFSNCSGLTSIVVADGNGKYHSNGNCIIETEFNSLVLGCKTSVIPTDGSVTSIGSCAFEGCTGLTNIVIPDTINYIGWSAFSGCSNLYSVTIDNSIESIDEFAFNECTSLTTINYSGTITEWNAITKETDWDANTGNYSIACTDGTITKE